MSAPWQVNVNARVELSHDARTATCHRLMSQPTHTSQLRAQRSHAAVAAAATTKQQQSPPQPLGRTAKGTSSMTTTTTNTSTSAAAPADTSAQLAQLTARLHDEDSAFRHRFEALQLWRHRQYQRLDEWCARETVRTESEEEQRTLRQLERAQRGLASSQRAAAGPAAAGARTGRGGKDVADGTASLRSTAAQLRAAREAGKDSSSSKQQQQQESGGDGAKERTASPLPPPRSQLEYTATLSALEQAKRDLAARDERRAQQRARHEATAAAARDALASKHRERENAKAAAAAAAARQQALDEDLAKRQAARPRPVPKRPAPSATQAPWLEPHDYRDLPELSLV